MSGMTEDELEMSEEISTLIGQKNELLAHLKILVAWYGKRGGDKDELFPPEQQEYEMQQAMILIAKLEASS